MFGKIGEVSEIAYNGDVKITYPEENGTFTYHPEVVSKVRLVLHEK